MTGKYKNINHLTLEALRELKENGHKSDSRNGKVHQLFDNDLIIENPRARHLYLNGRTNNIFATLIEIVWVLSGRSEIHPVLSYVLPRAPEYSDDGKTWSGSYGPRLYLGSQLNNIIDNFINDKNSRQCVFSIWNPLYDTKQSLKERFGLTSSKDIPCNNFGWFWINEKNELCMKVGVRSNDGIFGVQVNVPEWTVLQELVYERLKQYYPDLKLGYYHHSPINLHYYEAIEKQVDNILSLDNSENINELKLLPLEFEFDEHMSFERNVKNTFNKLYELYESIIISDTLRNNDYYIDKLNEIIVNKKGSLYYYSMYSLLYLLYKVRSNKDRNLFDDLFITDLSIYFKNIYNKDLDICKAVIHNKFTPKEWKECIND